MNPKLEETFYADFITSSPTTGAAVDADSTPTCEVFEDATDTAILAPTVTKRTGKTGNYRVPLICTTANGFEQGKSYNAIVSATVGGVASKAVLQTFQIRTNGADDLAASILTRATPAQVQTELGTYGALKPTVATRTLDVSVGGEAGIDWANVGSPTASQNLSATSIATAATATTVTNPVTLTAAYDKAKTAAIPGDAMALTTGERTTLTGVIWNTLTSALTTAGSVGKLLVDNLDAKISTRSTYAGADTAGTTTLLSRIASALTITAGKVDVNDKSGFSLTAAYDPAKTAMQAGSAVTLTSAYDKAKTASQPGDQMTLTAAYDSAKTAAPVGSAMTLTSAYDAAKTAASPAQVQTELNTYGALKPTTVGTTLDVTAGGCAGIDWANIENNNVYRELLATYLYSTTTCANVNNVATVSQVIAPVATTKDAAIDGIKLTTDHLGTAMEVDGVVYRFTANALEQAPTGGAGGGEVDWTPSERDQIRFRLGIDGSTSTPVAAPNLATQASVNGIKTQTDKLSFTGLDVNATLNGEAVNLTPAYNKAKTCAQPGDVMGDSPGVTTLLGRVSSTLFTGITSLGQWLGIMAGEQIGNTTARTELRSTGFNGNGTYDETLHSLEAIRNHGDESWVGGEVAPPEPEPDPTNPCWQNPAQTRSVLTEP